MQVYEIIKNIKKLSENDLKILLEWIDEFEQELWDKEFEKKSKLLRV